MPNPFPGFGIAFPLDTPTPPPAGTAPNLVPQPFQLTELEGMTEGNYGFHTTKVGKIVYATPKRRMTSDAIARMATSIDAEKLEDTEKRKDKLDLLGFILGVCVSFTIKVFIGMIDKIVKPIEFFAELLGKKLDVELLLFDTMADLYNRTAQEMKNHGSQIRAFAEVAAQIYGAKPEE